MTTKIDDQHLPALYRAADRSSIAAQARFLIATRIRLGGVLAAAFFGLFVWTLEGSPVDWAGVIAAIAFFVALLAEVYLLTSKPERTWYEGRAAAESVKTLSWRYMMAAAPFEGSKPTADIDQLFLHQLNELLDVLKQLDLVVDDSSGEQITTAMRELRTTSLAQRKHTYEQDRVRAQQEWYSRKATWNRKHANRWTVAMLLIEVSGVVAAVLKSVGTITADLLGFGGAVVAAMAAWLQTKQHRTLATAYTVTALELASVRSRIAHQLTEADWANFIGDAEEAFSREHTLWKASRGVRSLQ